MQTKKRKARKLYFGWIIVGVAFLNMALQYTTNVNLGGLFVSALETEFSSSRTAVTTTLTLFSFGALFGALFANAILQRVPLRRVLIVARIATIVGFVGNAFSTSLPQIYVLSLIRGFCGPILTVIPTAIILNNWFSPKKRGEGNWDCNVW